MNYCKYDLTSVVEDATKRMQDFDRPPVAAERLNIKHYLQIFSWPQIWGSTACGFGGIGGAAMTTAQTVVVKCMGLDVALVYHHNKFAYAIEEPNEKFEERFRERNLPGAANLFKQEVEGLSG